MGFSGDLLMDQLEWLGLRTCGDEEVVGGEGDEVCRLWDGRGVMAMGWDFFFILLEDELHVVACQLRLGLAVIIET